MNPKLKVTRTDTMAVSIFLTELLGKWATLYNSVCLYGSGWACCCKKQPPNLKVRSH